MSSTCELQDRMLVRFEGRLDTARCAEIATELRLSLAATPVPVVFDLAAVDFISSAFLRLCIYAHKQAAAAGFRIVNAEPPVKRVFKIAGLDAMFKFE